MWKGLKATRAHVHVTAGLPDKKLATRKWEGSCRSGRPLNEKFLMKEEGKEKVITDDDDDHHGG